MTFEDHSYIQTFCCKFKEILPSGWRVVNSCIDCWSCFRYGLTLFAWKKEYKHVEVKILLKELDYCILFSLSFQGTEAANFSILERFETKGWQYDECLVSMCMYNRQNTTWKVFCTLFMCSSFLYQKLTVLFAALTHSTCDLFTTHT